MGPNGHIFRFLNYQMEIPDHEIDGFQVALRGSSAQSVDLFLEQHPEFEKTGKLALAVDLIPRETLDSLALSQKVRWYELLFGLMVEGGPFEVNPLSVLTFNYDRSLEAFFLMALKNFYGHNRPAPEARLEKIPIIHLYGSLGDNRAYEPTLTRDLAMSAANSIKIMHEVKPGDEFERAQKLLCEAAEVIFLGFGFHRLNVERLKIREVYSKKGGGQWFACRTEMGAGDVARAEAHLGIGIEGVVKFAPDPSWKIVEFLKNTPCLIP